MADSRIFIACKIDFETTTVHPEQPELSSLNWPKNCPKNFHGAKKKFGWGMAPPRATTALQLECEKRRPKTSRIPKQNYKKHRELQTVTKQHKNCILRTEPR